MFRFSKKIRECLGKNTYSTSEKKLNIFATGDVKLTSYFVFGNYGVYRWSLTFDKMFACQ